MSSASVAGWRIKDGENKKKYWVERVKLKVLQTGSEEIVLHYTPNAVKTSVFPILKTICSFK